MKILKLVLIISTILAVFTRSHNRRSKSSSKGFFTWLVGEITGARKTLFDTIKTVMTGDHKFDCTKYTEHLTGPHIKTMIPTSTVLDTCHLKCGWDASKQREFEEIVTYSVKISDDSAEIVTEFIHWLGKSKRRWAWENCFPSSAKLR
jgi:hypothetical protein